MVITDQSAGERLPPRSCCHGGIRRAQLRANDVLAFALEHLAQTRTSRIPGGEKVDVD
jgi:hypothetical protein